MKEIRLHGIGGLGTVKAGEMLVHAAVASGKFGNSIPFFGFERQGAPVTSYVRLGDEKIRPKNQVYHPNCTLVLDPSLLISAPVFEGLTENSFFIVNTKVENGADLLVSGVFASLDRRGELGERTAVFRAVSAQRHGDRFTKHLFKGASV